MAVFYSAQDFARALLALLPTGRVWPKDLESAQGLFMQALAQVYVRQTARSRNLVIDAFPATTVELLPEWENTLGLPDPCAGPSPTLGQRIAQVVARLTDSGGQSVAYFVELARRLGYDITVTQHAPSRFGRRFGSQFGDQAWAHAWRINAPQFTRRALSFGRCTFGEPFSTWGNTVLLCELQAAAPAHTTLTFSYQG